MPFCAGELTPVWWWVLRGVWSQRAGTTDPMLLSMLESGACPARQKRIGLGQKQGTQTTLKAAGCWDPFHVETSTHNRDFCHLFPLSVQLHVHGKDLERVNALLRQWHWSLGGAVCEVALRGEAEAVRFVSALFSQHFSYSSCQLLFSPTAGLVASLQGEATTCVLS